MDKNINKLRLCSETELSLKKTFECGQCFRWNADENGVYFGVALGRALRAWNEDGWVYLDAPERDRALWMDYFDLNDDYSQGEVCFHCSEYMEQCMAFGRGIRILRQDKWEALCSFIISQCNNIPRIQKIVEILCRNFGEPIEYMGKVYYSFPTAEKVAALSLEDLAVLRAGYRAPYILDAAKAVSDGSFDLAALDELDHAASMKQVRSLKGVGEKVANCFILFGLHKMEAFPIDVWMKRALNEHFPEKFDPTVFGPYAGLAQQYIFYYARSGEER